MNRLATATLTSPRPPQLPPGLKIIPWVTVRTPARQRVPYRAYLGKAAFDAVLAAGLLVASFPVLLVAAGLIRLTSRGPVVYTQSRLGRGGRSFVIYKLRTMRHDCEKWSGP